MYRAFCVRVDKLGGIEWIIGRIANGETLLGITRDLQVSRYLMWRYIHVTKERAERYAQARREGAGALAEEALEIADNANDLSPAGVSKAKLQVDSRKWLAGVHDRDTYGEAARAAGQTINIGTMHLHALEAHGGPQAQASLPAPKDIIDAVIVEDDDNAEQEREAAPVHGDGSAQPGGSEEGGRAAIGGEGLRGSGQGARDDGGAGRPEDTQPAYAQAAEVRHAEVEQLELL